LPEYRGHCHDYGAKLNYGVPPFDGAAPSNRQLLSVLPSWWRAEVVVRSGAIVSKKSELSRSGALSRKNGRSLNHWCAGVLGHDRIFPAKPACGVFQHNRTWRAVPGAKAERPLGSEFAIWQVVQLNPPRGWW